MTDVQVKLPLMLSSSPTKYQDAFYSHVSTCAKCGSSTSIAISQLNLCDLGDALMWAAHYEKAKEAI